MEDFYYVLKAMKSTIFNEKAQKACFWNIQWSKCTVIIQQIFILFSH